MEQIKKVEIGWRQGEKEGTIPVEVIYSDRRSIGLEIRPDGRVLLRAPRKISRKTLLDFLKTRKEWVVENYFLMEKRRKKEADRPPRDYETDPEKEALYRKLAKERICERAEYFAGRMGVTYNQIRIGSAKTRWGSCSGKGNLNFHWKLILMPPEVLDYVVVHELAHRKEMNHSPRFWAEVEKILPDYKNRRAWLKENGRNV